MIMWPLWWLVLKSPFQGAQTFLRAAMEAELGRGVGGRFLKECREVDFVRPEIRDEEIAKTLWKFSEKQIEALEKEGAVKRALAKKEAENKSKNEKGNPVDPIKKNEKGGPAGTESSVPATETKKSRRNRKT